LLHVLRGDAATRAVPALMTTTESAAEDHHASLLAGANAYLVKPVPRAQLALYVAAMTGRSVT